MQITIDELRAVAGRRMQIRIERQARRAAKREAKTATLLATPVAQWFLPYEQQMAMAAQRGEFEVTLKFHGADAELKANLATIYLRSAGFNSVYGNPKHPIDGVSLCRLTVSWEAL